VSYSVFFAAGAKVATAVNLRPGHTDQIEGSTDFANKVGSQHVASENGLAA
jgi:hypothetical protein